MIDGSYFLPEMPLILGEYILEVNVVFENLNSANYCKKVKI